MALFDFRTDEDPRLEQARMDLLAPTLRSSLGFMAFLFAVVGALMWGHVHAGVLLTWEVAMVGLTAFRLWDVRHNAARAAQAPDALPRAERRFLLGMLASGALWGAAGVLMFRGDDVLRQCFLSFVLAGISASAVSIYAPHKTGVRSFLCLTLVPHMVAQALVGDALHYAMAALLLAFLGVLLKFSAVAHASVAASLALRFQNEDLIAELTGAKQAAEQINRRLSAEIEQRKGTEAALIEARDRAEQAARAKSDFLATMSHEIRTPMNGVLGMTELILATELNGKQRRFASTIRRSGEALLAIINDILDFSKIEAGKLEIQHTVFDLRQLVEDTVAFFAEQAQRKHLALHADFPPGAHAAYRGDPDRIRQVLMNLVGNALKFTERGEVLLKVLPGARTDDREHLRFEVRDTGIGIAPAHQAHIFESFRQADGSTTRRFGGTGLGLAISARLVELMRGAIGVDSTEGRGSTFCFELELTRMPASSIAAQIASHTDFAGRRVLVVDDHATNREILQHQFENWGMHYRGAETGEQGMTLLAQAARAGQPYDVVVLDRRLPDTDGIDLARRIKAEPALAASRLVMLSSIDQLEQTGQWLKAGIEVYVNKPVRQTELHDAIGIALAAGGAGPTIGAQAELLPSKPPAPAVVELGAHVLVAEDNPVNQELARSMLEALGCSVVVVEDGEQALEAITDSPLDRRQRPYDLVLMDCQMPRLDGFEATRGIRRWEARNERQRPLPIVALTANALSGDRERCLKAGMTDYLAKPFTQEQLAGVVKRWMTLDVQVGHAVKQAARSASAEARAASAPSVNLAKLDSKMLAQIRALERDGQDEVLARVVGIYLKNAPKLLEKMQQAASTGNDDLLRNAAHSLKSASANLGATRLATLCAELETLGRDGGAARALAPLGVLEFEFEAVCNALALELAGRAA
ncbi:MAG: response regulator [Gammaproteobacteria bacterium]